MTERKVIIAIKEGLQSKPAAVFVEKASTFTSNIMIIKDEKTIAAKSIMGVMAAALSPGTEVILQADGPDEEQALESLEQFLSTQ